MGFNAATNVSVAFCPLPTPTAHLTTTFIGAGEPTVMIEGNAALRRLDIGQCAPQIPNPVSMASFSVKIGGQYAARQNDSMSHPGGFIITGSSTVLIGDIPYSHAGEKYATREEAAAAACEECNSKSIPENVEYAGNIYQNPDGSYSYSPPVTDDLPDRSTPENSPVPDGCPVVGDYHAHGDYTQDGERTSDPTKQDPNDNADAFSQDDIDATKKNNENSPGYRSYVATPNGSHQQCVPGEDNPRAIGK